MKDHFHSLAVLPPRKGHQYTLRLVGPQERMDVLETTEVSASAESRAPDYRVSVPSTQPGFGQPQRNTFFWKTNCKFVILLNETEISTTCRRLLYPCTYTFPWSCLGRKWAYIEYHQHSFSPSVKKLAFICNDIMHLQDYICRYKYFNRMECL